MQAKQLPAAYFGRGYTFGGVRTNAFKEVSSTSRGEA